MIRILILLIFVSFLPACVVPVTPNSGVNRDTQIKLIVEKKTGLIGIDDGGYKDKETLSAKNGKTTKTFGRLNKLLGSGFDPSVIKAPAYGKAKYKSKISKELLLDELMTNAYDAYKKVSGKRWRPKLTRKDFKSQDLLLRKDRWFLKSGESLRDVLFDWGRRANWKVVWQSDYEYPVKMGILFKGSFTRAIKDTLDSFKNRTPRLYATFYKNRVVVFRNENLK